MRYCKLKLFAGINMNDNQKKKKHLEFYGSVEFRIGITKLDFYLAFAL